MGTHASEAAKMIVEELQLPITADEFQMETKQQMEVLFLDTEVLPGEQNFKQFITLNYCLYFSNLLWDLWKYLPTYLSINLL